VIITSHYSVVNKRYESLQQRNTLATKWGSVIKAPGKTAKDCTQRQEQNKIKNYVFSPMLAPF